MATDARSALLEQLSAKIDLPFGVHEYAERVARTRQALGDAGFAAAYFTSPEAIYYLTGFHSDWWQAQMPALRPPLTGVVLGGEDGLIHFVHVDEVLLAESTTWGPETRVLDAAEAAATVGAAVADAGGRGGKVGLERSSYRPPRAGSDLLADAIVAAGAAATEDVSSTIRAVMRVKSPQELAYTRTAARLGDIGLAAGRAALRPGVTETEVLGEIVDAMSTAGAENPSITMPVFSGPKAAMLHSLVSRRRIMPGDVVCLDVAGVYNRYHADAARTFFIGEPPSVIVDRVAASARAYDVLLAGARPGRLVVDVLEELQEHYRAAGIIDDVWWMGGYELPASFPPDWVGEYSFDALEDNGDLTLIDGLVTNYESNFYLPDLRGVSLMIDTLLIDGEPELLHTTTRELVAIEA